MKETPLKLVRKTCKIIRRHHLWVHFHLQTAFSDRQMHEKGIIVCDDAATEELKVGTYRYFKDIEAGHLDPESLIK